MKKKLIVFSPLQEVIMSYFLFFKECAAAPMPSRRITVSALQNLESISNKSIIDAVGAFDSKPDAISENADEDVNSSDEDSSDENSSDEEHKLYSEKNDSRSVKCFNGDERAIEVYRCCLQGVLQGVLNANNNTGNIIITSFIGMQAAAEDLAKACEFLVDNHHVNRIKSIIVMVNCDTKNLVTAALNKLVNHDDENQLQRHENNHTIKYKSGKNRMVMIVDKSDQANANQLQEVQKVEWYDKKSELVAKVAKI